MQVSAQQMKFPKFDMCYMYLYNIITLILSLKNEKVFYVLETMLHDLQFETLRSILAQIF